MKSDAARSVAAHLIGTRHDWRIQRPRRPFVPMFGLHWSGPLVVLVSVLIGWFAFTEAINEDGDSGVGFSLFIGSVSILLMAWSNLLSTRVRVLESSFGGLDRVYRWHRWYGAVSVGAMWLHMQIVDDVEGIRGASKDIADAAEDLADTGSTVLYILVAVSLLRWLPTKWWRTSHKLLVLPYIFACWHFYTSTKPYDNFSPWGWWFNIMMLLGIVAWVYRVIWRDMIRRGYQYTVSSIVESANSVTLELEPCGKPLTFAAGQFVFLKPLVRTMSEPHPFTIASSPAEMNLRFVIRDLGDWTHHLPERLHAGDRVIVEGPYGDLHPLPHHHVSSVIWIAGGVGITPFLGSACARDPHEFPTPHLFYCVRSAKDAPALEDLQRAHADGRIHLHLHESAKGNRLRAHDIELLADESNLSDAYVVMCGPDALVNSMRKVVRNLGARQIHVEAFDIRTGIGPDMSRHVDRITTAITSARR